MFATVQTIGWAGVISDLLVALILGVLGFSRKWIKRELIDPVQELRADFKTEKRKRKQFQKTIVTRMDHYEAKAELERQAQNAERARVAP